MVYWRINKKYKPEYETVKFWVEAWMDILISKRWRDEHDLTWVHNFENFIKIVEKDNQ